MFNDTKHLSVTAELLVLFAASTFDPYFTDFILSGLIDSPNPDLFCLNERWIKPTTTFTNQFTVSLIITLFSAFLVMSPTTFPLSVISGGTGAF